MAFRLVTSVLVAMAFASAPAALACKGRQVVFEDKFQEEDSAWDIAESEGAAVTIGGGKLEIKPKEGWSRMVLYGGATFREGDICVDYIMPETKEPAVAGMLFWGANYGSLFAFFVNTVGEAKIVRRQIAKGTKRSTPPPLPTGPRTLPSRRRPALPTSCGSCSRAIARPPSSTTGRSRTSKELAPMGLRSGFSGGPKNPSQRPGSSSASL